MHSFQLAKRFRTLCLFTLPLLASPLTLAAPQQAVVIGAGLSGLNTALLLEEHGFEVTVLEARQRIGGRLYTLDDVPGHPETGGNIIGPNYARIIDRAKQLDIALVPATNVVGGMRNMSLYIDGQFFSPRDWAQADSNPFPPAFKPVPPGSVMSAALGENPLKGPADWTLPAFAQYDIPALGFFEANGFKPRALELMNHTSGNDTLAQTSLLQLYRSQANFAKAMQTKGFPMAVAGGNQRLPEAMAKALKNPVLTGKIVNSIQQRTDGITVKVADGSSYKADIVVSSVPLTALRNIAISPALPTKQQQAIDQFTYSKALIVHLTVSGEYWGKQTPSLWTDTTIERIFATTLDGSGKVSNITLWITGDNAMHYSAMEPKQRDKAILDTFKKIYPDAKCKVKIAKVVDWNKDPFSQGTWANWLPGQQQLVNVLSKPSGKLFFAGEHTAISNSGMEAAMESSERVVAEILGVQANSAQLFMACQACHSLAEGDAHKLGPNLHGFFNQPAATREAYAYSEALSNAKLTWDRKTLEQWLIDPEQLVPGTKMVYHNNYSADQLEQLIDYLAIEGAAK